MIGGQLLSASFPKRDVRMEQTTLVLEGCLARSEQELGKVERHSMAQNDEFDIDHYDTRNSPATTLQCPYPF
jgi:hypothetical protein